MPELEDRVTDMEQQLALLRQEHSFFKQTVLDHMANESKDVGRIYDKLESIKSEVHKMPVLISGEVSSCSAKLKTEIAAEHPRRHEVVTHASLRTYIAIIMLVATGLFTGVNWVLDKTHSAPATVHLHGNGQ